jgi:hypothetical protein
VIDRSVAITGSISERTRQTDQSSDHDEKKIKSGRMNLTMGFFVQPTLPCYAFVPSTTPVNVEIEKKLGIWITRAFAPNTSA